MKYRKRPVVIEARLFDPGLDYDEACDVVGWCGGRATDEGCEISTLEGVMLASPGDYVIKGVAAVGVGLAWAVSRWSVRANQRNGSAPLYPGNTTRGDDL